MAKSTRKRRTDAHGLPWWEKARRIIEESGRSYRSVERTAAWPESTLGAAIKRGSAIGVEKAISLARALGVPADWLFDPAQPWEARPQPPEAGPNDPLSRLCRAVTQGYAAWKELTADTETGGGKGRQSKR